MLYYPEHLEKRIRNLKNENIYYNDKNKTVNIKHRNELYGIFYLQYLPTTCSTLYIGNIFNILPSSYQSYENDKNLAFKTILDWATTREIGINSGAGYSEIICTIKNRQQTLKEVLESYKFKPLGEPFKNNRTLNILQHYHLLIEDKPE